MQYAYGLLCNSDGQKTAEDDVFDLAELCWTLAKVEGWTDDFIGRELNWQRVPVAQHRSIKEKLHKRAWDIARWGVTRDLGFVTEDGDSLVTEGVTNVTWKEGHFRALLSILPCPNGDRSVMRAQVSAIKTLMAPPKNDKDKLTAKRAGDVATKYAWHQRLARAGFDILYKEVKFAILSFKYSLWINFCKADKVLGRGRWYKGTIVFLCRDFFEVRGTEEDSILSVFDYSESGDD